MKSKPISTTQFVGWLVLSGLGVILWIAIPLPLFGLAGAVLAVSSLVLQSSAERRQPLAIKTTLLIAVMLAGVAFAILVLRRLVPDENFLGIVRFIRHPGFILPLWLLGIWQMYLRWQMGANRGKSTAQRIS